MEALYVRRHLRLKLLAQTSSLCVCRRASDMHRVETALTITQKISYAIFTSINLPAIMYNRTVSISR